MTQNVTIIAINRPATTESIFTSQVQFNDFLQNVMVTDLDNVFFNGLDFNEPCMIYHRSLNKWENYNVNFDDPSTSVDFGSDVDVTDLKPQIMVNSNALKAELVNGDKAIVRGTKYDLENVNHDGVGVWTAYLTRL